MPQLDSLQAATADPYEVCGMVPLRDTIMQGFFSSALFCLAGLTLFVYLVCHLGSDSDDKDEQDDEEEDGEGEPLLAVEKRARILDKKRYCLVCGYVSSSLVKQIALVQA